ncbi:MAG: HIT domain-containing protein [Clostridia bacterium]|nr:HIT domain-containing protein [Clostridia bacterium]
MEDCLFCKFINGAIPVDKLYEDDDFIVIRDINPQCKNHFLAITKSHFKLLADMTECDALALARILKKIPALCDKLELKNGYRLVINQGDDAGQTVPHLHIHVLSGEKMGWDPAGRKERN